MGIPRGGWLETILDLEAGVPSHNRFNAIFRALDPAALGLLKNERSEKIGVKNKRLAAACNARYMEKVITGS